MLNEWNDKFNPVYNQIKIKEEDINIFFIY